MNGDETGPVLIMTQKLPENISVVLYMPEERSICNQHTAKEFEFSQDNGQHTSLNNPLMTKYCYCYQASYYVMYMSVGTAMEVICLKKHPRKTNIQESKIYFHKWQKTKSHAEFYLCSLHNFIDNDYPNITELEALFNNSSSTTVAMWKD